MKQIIAICCLIGVSSSDKLDNTYLPPSNAGTASGSNFLQTPYQGIHSGSPFGFPNTNGFSRNNGFGNTFQGQTPQSNYLSNGFSSPNTQRYNQLGLTQGLNGGLGDSNAGFRPPSYPINADGILRYNSQNNGDGTYQFDFETENKISQKEVGQLLNAGTPVEASVVRGDYSYVAPNGKTVSVNYVADENGFRASGDHIPESGQYRGQFQGNSFGPQNAGYNGQYPLHSGSQFKQVDNQIRAFSTQYRHNQISETGPAAFGTQNDFSSNREQIGFGPLTRGYSNGLIQGTNGLLGASGASRQYLPPSSSVHGGY